MISEGEKNPYNKLSDELKKRIKKLESPVTIIAAGVFEPATGKYHLKSSWGVPNKDRIYDPGKNEYIDIAMIETIEVGGEPKFYDLWLREATKNMMLLFPGNSTHEMIYEWLQLSNFSGNRMDGLKNDPSKEIYFHIHDIGELSNKKRDFRKQRQEAYKAVIAMSDEEIRSFVKAWDGSSIKISAPSIDSDIRVLRDWMEELADTHPENIQLEEVSNTEAYQGLEESLKDAAKKKLISFDRAESVVKWEDGETVTSLVQGGVGFSWYKALAEWVANTNEGGNFFESLKDKLENE